MNRGRALLFATCLVVVAGCDDAKSASFSGHPSAEPSASAAAASTASDIDDKLAAVAHVHGGAGPWVVAGYRMGEHALHELGLEHGTFDLEVVHFTPHEVQYSCIADGAAAATGASLGKLNLTLTEVPAPETHTVYRRKSTGKTISLRVTKAFASRFVDVPRERLADAGREVMQLRDVDIFELAP